MIPFWRIALTILFGGSSSPAQNLLENGTFDRDAAGWTNQSAARGESIAGWSASEGRHGSGCIRNACDPKRPDDMHIWRAKLASSPTGKRLRFSGHVRGEQVVFAGICMQVWNRAGDGLVQFGTTQQRHEIRGDVDWTRIESTVVVPADAGEVHLLTMLSGGGKAWFDDIEVVIDGDATEEELAAGVGPDRGKPGLFELRGEYEVSRLRGLFGSKRTTEQPKLLFPVPLCYGAQVPLSYEIDVQPRDQLVAARIYEDRPGNFVAEVVLATPAPKQPTKVQWRAIVACGPSDFSGLPAQAPIPEQWPDEVRPWLTSTRICQADDPALQAEGKAIRGESEDVLAIVAATLVRARAIQQAQEGRCEELDARAALTRAGSCTSNANLFAALLRAQGVPARVLAGYPIWSGPLQTHYTVEAYVPQFGWYPIESTLLQAPWPGHAQIQVSIVPVEYEGDSSRPRSQAAGGVPYLSLTEARHPDGLFIADGNIDGKEGCDHVAKQVKVLADLDAAGWLEVLTAARTRWHGWLQTKANPATDCATPRRAGEWLSIANGTELRGALTR
jgi:transglutaminase-like putative cysteine protease